MPRATHSVTLLPLLAALAACSDGLASGGTIKLEDNCEPASFNAALGAGACQHASSAPSTPAPGTGCASTSNWSTRCVMQWPAARPRPPRNWWRIA